MASVAQALVAYTESWWGETLDRDLLLRMRSAPVEHLLEFLGGWDGGLRDHPELRNHHVPPIADGGLRPILKGFDYRAGLSALLYTDSVLLSSRFLAPLSAWDVSEASSDDEIAEAFIGGMQRIYDLKPLIERDLVYFTNVDTLPYQNRDYSRGFYLSNSDVDFIGRDPRALARHGLTREEWEDQKREGALHRVEVLWREHIGTPVALDDFEARLFASWGSQMPDRRGEALASLVAMSVPDVAPSVGDLVRLRYDEVLFADWRDALRNALGSVRVLDRSPESIREARSVVAHELEHATARLRSGVRKSAALQRVKAGTRGFAVGALSAAPVEAVGALDPWSFFAKTGAAGAIGAGLAVTADLRDRKRADAALVDNLVLSFKPVKGVR